MKKLNNLSDLGGLVYSTNPDQKLTEDLPETPAPPNADQPLRIWLERGKGGKESTVIKGFVGPTADREDMAKMLKNKCAAGGNAKDGIVIIQGNHREKILKILLDLGYKNTKKAGG